MTAGIVAPPPPNHIVNWIRSNCTIDPSALAIVDGERSWSYGQLLKRVDSAAATLHDAGLRAGDIVLVRALRVRHLPVALLSVWALGATAAIVDGTLPPPRLRECHDVVQPHWHLAMDGPERLAVAGAGGRGATAPARRREHSSHILFTSGTTGRPAAVEVGHGALHRTLAWYLRTFRPDSRDRVALLAGLGHDPMLRDTLVPLMCGGTLAIPPPGVFAHPDALLSFVQEARPTVIHCTPALLELILAAVAAAGGGLESVRLVVSAGAPLTWGTVRRLRTATRAVLVNAYGCTETPQIASCTIVQAGEMTTDNRLADDATVAVGTGVNGAELLVADAHGRVEPGKGVDPSGYGEIIVRSPNLARGYLAGTGVGGRFIPDPRGVPGYRAYRTGDLGRRGDDATIHIEGRLDRQMSVNGFRLAPEEIERTVLRHPAVAVAAVRPTSTPTGDLIELSVVLAEPGAADARSLRAFLRSALPNHAVPSRIRILPALALDANHKTGTSG